MFDKLKTGYQKYTNAFWILILATFIDQIGGAMLFPFFSLYITKFFKVGLTEVGIIFSLFSIGSIIGNFIGGAAADRFGRKAILFAGIIISGLSSLLMGSIEDFKMFYVLALILGIVGSIGQPAQQAMVADLLPPELQADGFGIIRIAANLSVALGPFLGSLVLGLSNSVDFGGIFTRNPYFILFVGDAVFSTITAIIVLIKIPETKPEKSNKEKSEDSMIHTFTGYFKVLSDGLFMIFVLLSSLVSLVYMQMNSTLSVFLRDQYGFVDIYFGYLLSMNAFMVVFFQFPITHAIKNQNPVKMMALGTFLYAIGFGMYGFVSTPIYFVLAMIIITLGEMIISPFSQSIVAKLAPEDKRGRYMAVFGFSWILPSIFGVLVAGIIMDNYNPNLVWIIGGFLLVIAALGYLSTNKIAMDRFINPSITQKNDPAESSIEAELNKYSTYSKYIKDEQ